MRSARLLLVPATAVVALAIAVPGANAADDWGKDGPASSVGSIQEESGRTPQPAAPSAAGRLGDRVAGDIGAAVAGDDGYEITGDTSDSGGERDGRTAASDSEPQDQDQDQHRGQDQDQSQDQGQDQDQDQDQGQGADTRTGALLDDGEDRARPAGGMHTGGGALAASSSGGLGASDARLLGGLSAVGLGIGSYMLRRRRTYRYVVHGG